MSPTRNSARTSRVFDVLPRELVASLADGDDDEFIDSKLRVSLSDRRLIDAAAAKHFELIGFGIRTRSDQSAWRSRIAPAGRDQPANRHFRLAIALGSRRKCGQRTNAGFGATWRNGAALALAK